jgi:hypothetical protein
VEKSPLPFFFKEGVRFHQKKIPRSKKGGSGVFEFDLGAAIARLLSLRLGCLLREELVMSSKYIVIAVLLLGISFVSALCASAAAPLENVTVGYASSSGHYTRCK